MKTVVRLCIQGTLWALLSVLSSFYYTDKEHPNPSVTSEIQLTSLCSDNPDVERRWRVTNSFNLPIEIDYEVVDGTETGTFTASPGKTIFFTQTISDPSNTLRISWFYGQRILMI